MEAIRHEGPGIGDALLGGRYTLLAQVKAPIGGTKTYIGNKGQCRYCGERGARYFKTEAHAFPEGLGNRWVISRDECDKCNHLFSKYDDAIVRAVGPFLTLGGVKGKSKAVRQTGRSDGPAILARRLGQNGPALSILATNAEPSQHMAITAEGTLRLNMPVADDLFKPRYAYKALVKMAVALLPETELANYSRVRAWLLDPDDPVEFPHLDVGISFASVGNAPPLLTGALLRRTDPKDLVPHILFVFSAGSVCFQIDLMSDHLEDHLPPLPPGTINIEWTNVVGNSDGSETVSFHYGRPKHLNWSSAENQPQPVKEIVLDFNPRTNNGSLTPIFR
jgi:hypothetical protein